MTCEPFSTTSSIYISFGNLIQMKMCASSGSSNKHLTAPDVRSVLLPEKKKLIAAGARADIAGLALLCLGRERVGVGGGYPLPVFNQAQSDGMRFIALWWRALLWRRTVTLHSKRNHRLASNSERKGLFVIHGGVRQPGLAMLGESGMNWPNNYNTQAYIWVRDRS